MNGASSNLDTLAIGSTWRSSGRTLTEADLVQSCMTSTDWHAIHADEAYAARTPAGQRIFHGSYGLHVALGMATHFPPNGDDIIGLLGLAEWNFLAPLFVGDTVHVEIELAGKRVTSDGRRAIFERRIRLVRHDGKTVQEGVARTMLRLAVEGAAP